MFFSENKKREEKNINDLVVLIIENLKETVSLFCETSQSYFKKCSTKKSLATTRKSQLKRDKSLGKRFFASSHAEL